jgi:hypothetical protein
VALAARAISDVCGGGLVRLGARLMPRAQGEVDGLAQIARRLLADAITIARANAVEPRGDRVLHFVNLDDVGQLAPAALWHRREMAPGIHEIDKIDVLRIDRDAECFNDGLVLRLGADHDAPPVRLVAKPKAYHFGNFSPQNSLLACYPAVMTKIDADRFRKEAEECREQAAKAISQLDREAWLRLAARLDQAWAIGRGKGHGFNLRFDSGADDANIDRSKRAEVTQGT